LCPTDCFSSGSAMSYSGRSLGPALRVKSAKSTPSGPHLDDQFRIGGVADLPKSILYTATEGQHRSQIRIRNRNCHALGLIARTAVVRQQDSNVGTAASFNWP